MGHHDHAGGKTHHSDNSTKKDHSGNKHDHSSDEGKLSEAMSAKSAAAWSDPRSIAHFLNSFAHIWNNDGDGDKLASEETDRTMRDALVNLYALRGYLHDGQGDMEMVKLALDTWKTSVRDTAKRALDIATAMPDVNVTAFHHGMAAFYDVIDFFAEMYERSDQQAAEEAGAGAGIKAPQRSSKKERADIEKACEDADEMAKNGVDAITGLSGNEEFESGVEKIKQIYEVLTGPGELADNLKKQKGALGTMKSIDQVLQYAETVLELFVTSFFEIAAKLETGEAAEYLSEISESFGKALGRGAGALQMIEGALDCIEAISDGDYRGAARAAVTSGEGFAMMLAPEAAGPIGAAEIWWFEMEGLTQVTANFIDMINDQAKQTAVEKLIEPAENIAPFAQAIGKNLQAWGKSVADTSLDPEVRAAEVRKLKLAIDGDAAEITRYLKAIHTELATKGNHSVGGYDDLMAAYEVGTYNAAPDSKVDPTSLGAKGWNPPSLVYTPSRFTELPGFVRAVLHGVQSVASVAGGDAPDARIVRLTELQRIDGNDDLIPGGTAKIAMPFNADGGSSVIEVTDVRVDSDDDAFEVTNHDYARHLKSAGYADASDQINHPIEVKFSPKGYGPVTGTVTITVAFPDGHSETRSLKITGMN